MNKQEPEEYKDIVKPFNSSYKEYVSCREEREDCKDEKVFSDVSSTYDETRVKDLPPVQKNIEYVKPPNDQPPPRNTEPFLNNTRSFNYKEFESGEQNVNDERKITQQPSEVSNNYKALIFTVLATTSVYYFFFKLSK